MPSYSGEPPERVVALVYPDAASSKFLKEVLISMDILFKETDTPKGKKVEWASDSEEQEKEIQSRVSQYNFVKEACKEMPLPSPSAPARDRLSC